MPITALNGIDINYEEAGAGDPLVLIHNLTSNIRGFDRNIPALSRRFRTVAADLRGHGYTTHEDSEARAEAFYRFDDIVDDHITLLDRLGIDRFFLFGQAYWGANTALHLFDRMPERVRGIVVSSAYMISTDPGVKTYEMLGETGKQNFIRMHELARREGMLAVYDDRLKYGQFWSERLRGDAGILAEFKDAHRLTSPTAFVTIPHIGHERRAAIAAKLRARATPLMLLLGADDTNNDQMIAGMRQDCPDVHIVMIPESGHYPTIENPRDFNHALLNFYAGAREESK